MTEDDRWVDEPDKGQWWSKEAADAVRRSGWFKGHQWFKGDVIIVSVGFGNYSIWIKPFAKPII